MVYKNCRGWGLRCLDDIPAGGFICVYAGQVLSEQGANEVNAHLKNEYTEQKNCLVYAAS